MKARVRVIDRLSPQELDELYLQLAEKISYEQEQMQLRMLRVMAVSMLQEELSHETIDAVLERFDVNCERFKMFKEDKSADWAIESDLIFHNYKNDRIPLPKDEM